MRELQGLGEALREREGELGAYAERLERAVSDAKSERARQGSWGFYLCFESGDACVWFIAGGVCEGES